MFEHCQLSLSVGVGVHYNGVSAREVHSACLMLRVPGIQWPDVLADAQFMGRIVSNALNQRRGGD